MSITLMSLAFRLSVPITPKMVLLALCDWADDEGQRVYPSIKKLSLKSSLSERQTQRVVHDLIREGWIDLVGNENGGGRNTRQYAINVEALQLGFVKNRGAILSPQQNGVTDESSGVTNNENRGAIDVTQSIREPSIDPLLNLTPKKPAVPPMFEKFMDAFPKHRKDTKEKSLPAYKKAITKITEENLYAACVKYAGSDEATREGGRFAKGTVAWLNGDRWNREYAPASHQGQAPNGKPNYGDSLASAARRVGDLLREESDVRP